LNGQDDNGSGDETTTEELKTTTVDSFIARCEYLNNTRGKIKY
jgi:hypothetical protein